MLSYARTLEGYRLSGLDGEIGSVKDFLFDDRHWTIRYLVAETGNWLTARKVLVSPYAVSFASHENKLLSVDLTKTQIEESPGLELHEPVSRRFEAAYHSHFGWPAYWDGPYAWGAFPYLLLQAGRKVLASLDPEPPQDPNLRSTKDMTGIVINGTDGAIGRIKNFILDEGTWTIRYLLVETGAWWPGKKVLLSPRWIEPSAGNGELSVKMSLGKVRTAPEFVEAPLVSREYETLLHLHYRRPRYWQEPGAADSPARDGLPATDPTPPTGRTR
jgi:hypothetical protein